MWTWTGLHVGLHTIPGPIFLFRRRLTAQIIIFHFLIPKCPKIVKQQFIFKFRASKKTRFSVKICKFSSKILLEMIIFRQEVVISVLKCPFLCLIDCYQDQFDCYFRLKSLCLRENDHFGFEKVSLKRHYDNFRPKYTYFWPFNPLLRVFELEIEPKWSFILVRMNPPRSQ